MNVRRCFFVLAAFLMVLPAVAEDDPLEGRSRLYSKPDPTSPGGIQGRILKPDQPIEQILAIPADEPRLVYKGEIRGKDQRDFLFEGLPMRKYDLVVIYENMIFEGLQLMRGGSTLTNEDEKKIRAGIEKSEPFYSHKVIHRLQGETGRGQAARAICTFYLDRKSELFFNSFEGEWTRDDPRRAFKLVMLKDVGVGWQIERTRDLYSKWATMATLNPKHQFRPQLSRIRVADSIKDVGGINLAL